MKPIVHTPNPVLITPTKEVGSIDKKVKEIVSEMKYTLIKTDNPKGVGLAATQIGISLRIFIIRPEETDQITVYINPRFISKGKTMLNGIPGEGNRLEGCLSIPNIWGIIKRHKSITLKYLDETGQKREEKFQDFPAIIVQHEMDHLDGILFPRRVIEQKGTLYKPGKGEKGEDVLEPMDI